MLELNKIHLMDCMEGMKTFPDNYFDLAIVDPPYGIGAENHAGQSKNGWNQWDKKEWDSATPRGEYFDELFRVSKNQIVWGANYMTEYLPPSMGWIFWDKGQRDFSLADGELAFSSFKKALRVFEMPRGRALADDNKTGGKIHPTQKPVQLYKWLLRNYAEPGQKILDTHVGSGSSIIAFEHFGAEWCGFEIDEDYHKAATERIERELRQTRLF